MAVKFKITVEYELDLAEGEVCDTPRLEKEFRDWMVGSVSLADVQATGGEISWSVSED